MELDWIGCADKLVDPKLSKRFLKKGEFLTSAYSFPRNYSFLNLAHKSVKTIRGRKLFMDGNHSQKYGSGIPFYHDFYCKPIKI